MGQANQRRQAVQVNEGSLVIEVGERSLRRIHTTSVAFNVSRGIANNLIAQAQEIMGQAQAALDVAVHAVVEASGHDVPPLYRLQLDWERSCVVLTPTDEHGQVLLPDNDEAEPQPPGGE